MSDQSSKLFVDGDLIPEAGFAESFMRRIEGLDRIEPHLSPDKADLQFLNWIADLSLKLVLVMGSAPHLLEEAKLERPERMKHGHCRPELWSPNILGKHYTIKKEYQGGTHASPIIHLRGGFTRMQPYGPRDNPTHRPKWIEPTLVGAGKKT